MGWVGANEFLDTGYDFDPTLEEEPAKRRKLPFPEWHLQAACWDRDESEFFGAKDTEERPALSMSDVNNARKICANCPVREICLRKSLGIAEDNRREEYGIWAGTSGRTRRRIWDLVDNGVIEMERIISDILAGKEAKYERVVELKEAQITLIPLRSVV